MTNATAYDGARTREDRRFPWITLLILCVLAVPMVIGLCKYGIKDTVPYVAPPRPTTVYEPPTVIVASYPLARAG
jgi:hypothetical protein